MHNIKFIVWKRSVLSFLHLPVSFQVSEASEMDMVAYEELLEAFHKMYSAREIRIALGAVKQVKPIRVWIIVPLIESVISFFPDKRIFTYRLLGKAAPGPSPPAYVFSYY